MKYPRRLMKGITLIAILTLTGCFSTQPEVEPDVPDIDTPAAPVQNVQQTAVFRGASADISVTWDGADFTKDIPADAMQILEELEYPGNDERYMVYATPTGYHFADYYPSFEALKTALTWQEDGSEDTSQVAAGCAVASTEPPVAGFPAYKELCYFNPADQSLSGAHYEEGKSYVTYVHCLIPISTPLAEQGVLYFWGIDDDGYDECAFLTGLSQKRLSITLQELAQ